MKIVISIFLFCLYGTVGFSQDLPFLSTPEAIHFQNTNLVVRWKASKHPWPKSLWVYRVLPTMFAPDVLSNLMALGHFTESDRKDFSTNALFYGNWLGAPNLRISSTEGEIEYNGGQRNFSLTDLAKDIPETNELFQLTTNFLPKLGIHFSDIAKTADGKPKISFVEDEQSMWPANGGTAITNIAFRGSSVTRLLNGVEYSRGDGGRCSLCFGEHGRLISIALHWRDVEPDKQYSAATPERIIKWIREGKAIQKHLPGEWNGTEATIDWRTVKKLTITKATAYYWGETFFGDREHRPILPSSVLPYAELSGTVDTGKTNLVVELFCPVIDMAQPAGGQNP
jgi:hypothetical protein